MGGGGRKAAVVARMDATLRDWNALFDALASEVGGERTRARALYARCAEAVAPHRDEASRQLARLRAASSETEWNGARAELERVFDKLRGLLSQTKIT